MALREVVGAGEPLNPEVIEQVRAAWGLTIRDGYGQTETTLQIGNSPGQPVKPGAMGKPAARLSRRAARSPTAPSRTRRDLPRARSAAARPDARLSGRRRRASCRWRARLYRTGDVAMRDADGYFTYVGRADDVFKASDYRISPFELESALIEHPAVAEAAVVPRPDPLRLAVPKAFVALAGGQPPDRDTALAIFRHLRAAPGAVQAGPAARIRRAAEDDLRQDPPGRAARRRSRRAAPPASAAAREFWEEDFPELR